MTKRKRYSAEFKAKVAWRSLKYECVYLNAFETGSEAR